MAQASALHAFTTGGILEELADCGLAGLGRVNGESCRSIERCTSPSGESAHGRTTCLDLAKEEGFLPLHSVLL